MNERNDKDRVHQLTKDLASANARLVERDSEVKRLRERVAAMESQIEAIRKQLTGRDQILEIVEDILAQENQ